MLADYETLLLRLDSTLAAKPAAIAQKNQQLAAMKQSLATEHDTQLRLKLMQDIYREYYVYNFDSAQVYVRKGLELARQAGNAYYLQANTLHYADLLAIGGLYVEAESVIKTLDESTLEESLRFDYYQTLAHIYRYWADYSVDTEYSSGYRDKANNYLRLSETYLERQNPYYYYYLGELYTYIYNDPRKARAAYLKSLAANNEDTRVYAMSCFALAGNYAVDEDGDHFEEYLIRASISDAMALTMENYALQTLAVQLCSGDGHRDLLRAQRYISASLEDAKFYHSRLRIIEISQNLPAILQQYQGVVKSRDTLQMVAIIVVSALLVVLLVFLVFYYRQNRRLSWSKNSLREINGELKQSYQQQESLNRQLHQANQRLKDTNRRREVLAKLFIDLCDKYITRLANFQTLVKRKIKANQVNELLSHITSVRLSEEDAELFYRKFDDAFLSLYPDFVSEFNALLQPDKQVVLKKEGSLTTELRIFALIRLGVKESSEISNLLFASPQTVYNYRSAMKTRARDKDSFEEHVRKLCTVITLSPPSSNTSAREG